MWCGLPFVQTNTFVKFMNLMKVFLFGIKGKQNMKKVNVHFTECSCKWIVIKIFKSIDLL